MTAQAVARPTPAARTSVRAEPFKPVLGWAAAGACFVTFFAYLILRWVTSGHFTPTPSGPVPTYTRVAADIWQAGTLIAAAMIIWRIIVRPYRRDGVLSVDGVMSIAFMTCWWQDTICNSLAVFTTNSAVFVNFGSWDNYIPGWVQPHGERIVEPLFGSSGLMYMWACLGMAALATKIMRRVHEAGRGRALQLGASLVVLAVFTCVCELIAVRLGLWAYQGAHRSWSIFAGTRYQYPVYEGFFIGLLGTCWGAVRYYRNDKGQPIVDRGLEHVNVSCWRQQVLRVLAMSGILNVIFLATWQLPMAHLATTQDPWPTSLVNLQHLTNSVCGAGSDRACPGPAVPISRPGSAYIDRDGNLQPATAGK